jgi:hypothetical protein
MQFQDKASINPSKEKEQASRAKKKNHYNT